MTPNEIDHLLWCVDEHPYGPLSDWDLIKPLAKVVRVQQEQLKTMREALEYAALRIVETQIILKEHKAEGWALAHHTLEKAHFVLSLEDSIVERKYEIKAAEEKLLNLGDVLQALSQTSSVKKEGG